MHEMRKSDAVQHHAHKHVDGRRELYSMHKLNDKERHKGGSSQSNREHRSTKSHAVSSQIPGAMRICGDWSEHMSSNGKVYFFNNTTRLSQWERPKEWSNSRTVDVRSKDKLKTASQQKVVAKHSSDATASGSGQKQHKSYSQISEAKRNQQQQNARSRANHDADFRDRDYRTITSNSVARDRDYKDIDYRDTNSARSELRVPNTNDTHQRRDRDYRPSGSGQHESKVGGHRLAGTQLSNSLSNSQSLKDHNGRSTVQALSNDHLNSSRFSNSSNDRDKRQNVVAGLRVPNSKQEESGSSNSNTPRLTSDASKRDWQGRIKGSVDSNDSNESTANGGEDPSTTSALVQTISNVLNQASASTDNSNDNSIEGNLKSALQMLLDAAVRNQHIPNNSTEEADTKVENVPEESPKRPQITSSVSDEHVNNSLLVSQNADKVLASLRSSLEEKLLSHVQGWPADQLERQSARISDDNHSFIVNHITPLCSSMKVARSQVRAAEIHSTLQEQRVLYIRQQIKDLEKSTTIAPFT